MTRTCKKLRLDENFVVHADHLAMQHKKQYGVYLCEWCNAMHLTTKLAKTIYVTPNNRKK